MSNPITIRYATKDDRKAFIGLWRKFLTEEASLGGLYTDEEHNVKEAVSLFTAYVVGHLHGVVVMAFDGELPVGVAMLGEDFAGGVNFISRFGRTCSVWCDYVEPSHRRRRISHSMLNYSHSYLKEVGFDGGISATKVEAISEANAFNYGVEKFATTFFYDFKRQK